MGNSVYYAQVEICFAPGREREKAEKIKGN